MPKFRVTEREQAVLGLVADGLQNKEVAARLGLTLPAVKQTLARLYWKLGVANRAAAAVWWLRWQPAAQEAVRRAGSGT